MIGKPEWFKRRKYGGWGVTPKTWQGYVYVIIMILPLILMQIFLDLTIQMKILINTLYLGVIFLDLMHIMITLKKDEREYKIEAISERNASWAMIIVLLVGILYQSTMLGLNGTGSIDLFLVAALIIGMLSKSISNIFLERKSL
ncbi:hypothetical protein HN789_01320 [archaeon]|jgi:hypothetical protein|nr:hypothetical protein [archaeon]MBT4022171.1 hypothetical protein [archaeon]MBT4272784.1 hypothetical protein [archaeon]MBT4461583.1 hypothetical protein [archaeon]MBT4857649.1 hypothetical protein [archaeon]